MTQVTIVIICKLGNEIVALPKFLDGRQIDGEILGYHACHGTDCLLCQTLTQFDTKRRIVSEDHTEDCSVRMSHLTSERQQSKCELRDQILLTCYVFSLDCANI